MSALTDLPPLREVIAKHGLSAQKSLGQNFLLDLNITGKIARLAADGDDFEVGTLIEIGPGPGGLTRALLAHSGCPVHVIERDSRCIVALEDVAATVDGRLSICEGDALEEDPASIGIAPRRIVANLPYNIATPLLTGWLETPEAFKSLTLMFQKEVADRLTAQPGTKAYGRLTVFVQRLCDVKRVMELPPAAFTPPPKVASTVVKLTPYETPKYDADPKMLDRVLKAAFGQRRKMLRASLKPLGGALDALDAAGIAPTLRAENLTVEDFCRLANAFKA